MNTPGPSSIMSTAKQRARGRFAGWLTGSVAVAWFTLGMALAVLAFIVGFGAVHLRLHLREHLVNRDGEILYTVALARQYANGVGSNLTRRINIPADQLGLALDISRMREGTLAVRLFDRDGRFVTAVPPTVEPTTLPADELAVLRRLQPASRFLEKAKLNEQFLMVDSGTSSHETMPLLEVNIPIHARGQTQLLAAAQLIVDGRPLTREYARIDQHLWVIALGLYVGGAMLLSAVLVWAYRRLRRAHQQLADRTARLLRANHELSLAAKTSALGSVTAHLIHGLSNPLANLQNLLSAQQGKVGAEMETVAVATHRMQQLVDEVVRVLGEERVGEQYELSLEEMADVLRHKLAAAAETAGVELAVKAHTNATLNNRTANLTLLILENLVHNALRVSDGGRVVKVEFESAGDGGVLCSITDEGPGVPAELLPRLFTPCHSTHGGSGLGLAISKQLANQLGAELALQASSPAGCVFTLKLPAELFYAGKMSERNRMVKCETTFSE
jgi:signal transduction histidine kinase